MACLSTRVFFVLLFVLDFAAGLLLLLSLNRWDIRGQGVWRLYPFVDNTADLLLCTLVCESIFCSFTCDSFCMRC